MRVGFLFNHDQVHQVAHSLPIAAALARLHPTLEIVVATGSARLTDEVRRQLRMLRAPELRIVELGVRQPFTRMCVRHLEGLLPVTKLGIYRDNLDFFAKLDVLVVAEKTSLLLRTRYGVDKLKLVHTRHGAGDRAIGFDASSAAFDHIFVAGTKIRDRLAADAGVTPERMSVVGYPKFDLLSGPRPRLPMQDNGRPTVLYNPHVSPHLSSWYRHGRAVLDWFARQDRYNLIFAPHCMLFERRLVLTIDRLRIDRPGPIRRRIRDAPHIHVDLGTPAASDMTYARAADIYLGDVSSQLYEFLIEPRPCLFIDSHATAWEHDPNFLHWRAGEVIGGVDRLGEALDRAVARHDDYREAQRTMFRHSFDLTAEPSAERAARALMDRVVGSPTPALVASTRRLVREEYRQPGRVAA